MKEPCDSSLPPTKQEPAIAKRPLRSPQRHGEFLQDPPLHHIDQVWQSSLDWNRQSGVIGDSSLDSLRKLGRAEVIDLATRYSNSYLNINLQDRSFDHVIMAGHQPELFHPGVWYKNFVLSTLGNRFNVVAINLVVDNDVCGSASILHPSLDGKRAIVGTIPVDRPAANIPFESRRIENFEYFRSFESRASTAIRDLVEAPIVNRLWPHVIASAEQFLNDPYPRLGHSIAAGRHRLENEIGLTTLEVPVSWIARSDSFTCFVESILLDLVRFQNDYNASLAEFRIENRIRSRSHPAPALECIAGWQESPFWVWNTDSPQRRRLFSRIKPKIIVLSNRDGWEYEIEIANFRQQFIELADQGIAIRPRALMTTMFSRLVLSDLFLHGIGGAKYDQLTDLISHRFFSLPLPPFLTLSATMKLPNDLEIGNREDWMRLKHTIRELKFHPERFIGDPSPEAVELIKQKYELTRGKLRNQRSHVKHESLKALNRELMDYTGIQREDLVASMDQARSELRSSEILDSREYSICLFPNRLIEDLKFPAT